jgi:DNA polymerase III subunit beta
MELTLTKEALNQALSITQSIVAKKTTMPILANVLLSVSEGQLRVSATDLEITAVVSAQAKVKSKGSTTVNGKILADLVRELPDGDITLKLSDGERLEITAKGSKLKIVGISAEEYPSLPGVLFEPKTKISSKQLLEMITKTLYAVSTDETRFNLNGVCFEIVPEGKGKKTNNTLRMVATDGHRLAMITRPAGSLDFQGRVIIPRKGLSEIRKVLNPEQETPVGIEIKEGFLILESGETRISMRLVDAEYPNYEQVIPKEKGIIAAIPITELSQALRRAALLVSDKGKCVKMEFSPGLLRISSSSPELGEGVEELPIQYTGKPLNIGFNALYILDVATSLGEAQTLNIELTGELGPGKFFGEGDESYFGIIMPMRLS